MFDPGFLLQEILLFENIPCIKYVLTGCSLNIVYYGFSELCVSLIDQPSGGPGEKFGVNTLTRRERPVQTPMCNEHPVNNCAEHYI